MYVNCGLKPILSLVPFATGMNWRNLLEVQHICTSDFHTVSRNVFFVHLKIKVSHSSKSHVSICLSQKMPSPSFSPHAYPHALLQPTMGISENMKKLGNVTFLPHAELIQKVDVSAQCGGNTYTSFCILHFYWPDAQLMTFFLSTSWISIYHRPIEINEALTIYTSYRSASGPLMFTMAHRSIQFCITSHTHEHPLTEIITNTTTWFMNMIRH